METDPAKNLIALLKMVGDPGQCRSCGADVYWVTTKTGKKMPVTPAGIRHMEFVDCPQSAKGGEKER